MAKNHGSRTDPILEVSCASGASRSLEEPLAAVGSQVGPGGASWKPGLVGAVGQTGSCCRAFLCGTQGVTITNCGCEVSLPAQTRPWCCPLGWSARAARRGCPAPILPSAARGRRAQAHGSGLGRRRWRNSRPPGAAVAPPGRPTPCAR